MTYHAPCEVCKVRPAEHAHHLFSQSRWAKKLYGDLIHDPRNIMYLCASCHLNDKIPKLTETQFCERLGIEKRGKV